MIDVSIDQKQVERIREALKDKVSRLPREVATAINATAKKVRFEASKALKQELKAPVKILKKAIKTKSSASKDLLQATIRLWKGHPIPLKHFGAKQMKKGGVTYRTNPKFKIRSILRNAFIVKQYGSNVYERVGTTRFPVKQIYGPSPGDAFAQAGIAAIVLKFAKSELPKQMERRIRFLLLKSSGGLRGKQT